MVVTRRSLSTSSAEMRRQEVPRRSTGRPGSGATRANTSMIAPSPSNISSRSSATRNLSPRMRAEKYASACSIFPLTPVQPISVRAKDGRENTPSGPATGVSSSYHPPKYLLHPSKPSRSLADILIVTTDPSMTGRPSTIWRTQVPSPVNAVLTGLTDPAGVEAATGGSSPDDAVLTGLTAPAGVEAATGRSSGAIGSASPHPVAARTRMSPMTVSNEIAVRPFTRVPALAHLLK